MTDAILIGWIIAFIVALIGCIPYGIWMIYTIIQKRWKRLGLQVGVPTVAFLLLMGISAFIHSVAYHQYIAGLYDAHVHLGDPVFEYASEREFTGDGYSISVYKLPSSIRTRFESADEKLLAEFPKHPSYRNDWSIERWRQSPFDDQFQDSLDLALSGYDAENAPELTKHFEAISAALKRENTFYAFFYKPSSGHVDNVDFFVVDLNGGRLYLINHNT